MCRDSIDAPDLPGGRNRYVVDCLHGSGLCWQVPDRRDQGESPESGGDVLAALSSADGVGAVQAVVQSPPQTVGRAPSMAATAAEVFCAWFVPGHDLVHLRSRQGRMDEHTRSSPTCAIAVPTCGSGSGKRESRAATAAQRCPRAMAPQVAWIAKPGISTAGLTSVSSRMSHASDARRSACRLPQRPSRFQVPIRMSPILAQARLRPSRHPGSDRHH